METLKPEVIQIAPQTWCISEFRLVNAFLLEGRDRAVLIDTGCGIADLSRTVSQLTDRPLLVLLTHGHADHAGGLIHFPDAPVCLKEEDREMDRVMPCDNGFRRMYIESRVAFRFPGEGHQEALLAMLPPDPGAVRFDRFRTLSEGDCFDLGGRTLQTIHTPGHSQGSCCFLDSATRILFSGDTVNHSIILMRQPDHGMQLVEGYHATLQKLWDLSDRYDRLAIGHDGSTVEKQLVKDYLDLTAGLLDGSIRGGYEEVGFRKGEVARLGLAELWYQCDA